MLTDLCSACLPRRQSWRCIILRAKSHVSFHFKLSTKPFVCLLSCPAKKGNAVQMPQTEPNVRIRQKVEISHFQQLFGFAASCCMLLSSTK